jgi:hypothetical protein
MTATATDRTELAHRESAGIAVSLFWSADRTSVIVEVLDMRTDEFFAFDVAPEVALDAFRHPYAYLAQVEVEEITYDELLAA